ncbi:hypothetical protein S245_056751, partial [Arachis hypogaea]
SEFTSPPPLPSLPIPPSPSLAFLLRHHDEAVTDDIAATVILGEENRGCHGKSRSAAKAEDLWRDWLGWVRPKETE